MLCPCCELDTGLLEPAAGILLPFTEEFEALGAELSGLAGAMRSAPDIGLLVAGSAAKLELVRLLSWLITSGDVPLAPSG